MEKQKNLNDIITQFLIPNLYFIKIYPHNFPVSWSRYHLLTYSPAHRQGALKELKRCNLLCNSALNNAIRVTDCKQGVEVSLPLVCTSSHTRCLVYDSSYVPQVL